MASLAAATTLPCAWRQAVTRVGSAGGMLGWSKAPESKITPIPHGQDAIRHRRAKCLQRTLTWSRCGVRLGRGGDSSLSKKPCRVPFLSFHSPVMRLELSPPAALDVPGSGLDTPR